MTRGVLYRLSSCQLLFPANFVSLPRIMVITVSLCYCVAVVCNFSRYRIWGPYLIHLLTACYLSAFSGPSLVLWSGSFERRLLQPVPLDATPADSGICFVFCFLPMVAPFVAASRWTDARLLSLGRTRRAMRHFVLNEVIALHIEKGTDRPIDLRQCRIEDRPMCWFWHASALRRNLGSQYQGAKSFFFAEGAVFHRRVPYNQTLAASYCTRCLSVIPSVWRAGRMCAKCDRTSCLRGKRRKREKGKVS